MPFSDAQAISKIAYGYITISGERYPTSAFEFALSHNNIPYLTALIDAGHREGELDGLSGGGEVARSNLSDALAGYLGLAPRASVRGGTRGSFTFRMSTRSSSGDDEIPQELTLEGWILTDVSAGDFSFGSDPSTVITLTHPAILIADDNFHVVGRAVSKTYSEPRPANVLAGLIDAIRFLGDTELTDAATAATRLVKERTAALPAKLAQHLTWGGAGAGWPTVDKGGDRLHHKLLAALQGNGSASPVGLVFQTLVNDWGLSIIPTYLGGTDALTVVPFNPWENASYHVGDNDMLSISLPSSGSRICGVVTDAIDVDNPGSSSQAWEAPYEKHISAVDGWVEETLSGVIELRAAPFYMEPVPREPDEPANTGLSAAAEDANDTATTVLANEPVVTPPAVAGSDFLTRFCKQEFCQLFFQDRTISVKLRLSLDKTYLPGRTCEIRSGDTTIKFLVTSVVHVVNLNQAEASTTVTGAYAHTSAHMLGVGAIPGGTVTENYAYS